MTDSRKEPFDFDRLAGILLGLARELLPLWFPNGKWSGREYKVGSLRGEAGDSMSINSKTGRWGDFNTGEAGGDLISLYAQIHGMKQLDAARELDSKYGSMSVVEHESKRVNHDIIIPPDGVPTPKLAHWKYGAPVAHWVYRAPSGKPLFYVCRYDVDGGKQIVPWSWSGTTHAWVAKSYPKPRPLYRLPELMASRGPVLLVEGEKACEAAQTIVGSRYAVTTWAGGSHAVKTVDWAPLAGRKILLWPDADRQIANEKNAAKNNVAVGEVLPYRAQPGPEAMLTVASMLADKCPEVKLIDVGLDPARADGWDAHDALISGWTWDNLKSWAVPRAAAFKGADVISLGRERSERSGKPPAASKSVFELWDELGLALNSNGTPVANEDNVLRIFERHGPYLNLVWYDDFYKRYLTNPNKPREWADVDTLALTMTIQREFGLKNVKVPHVKNAIQIFGSTRVKNAPREWMLSLEWDREPRIEHFMSDCMGAEGSMYVRAASKNFWIGMVARILHPGCKLDNMIILHGAQGIFKSTALEVIGGDWYTEAHETIGSKDFYLTIQGKLVIQIAELESFSRADATRIKQVVSNRTDRFRVPYGSVAEDHPRQCVFVGTTNEEAFLRDFTGGRRFWPIRCQGEINLDGIREQREQLFAEAASIVQAGGDWWSMPAGETAAVQEEFREADEWEHPFAAYLHSRREVELKDVLDEAVNVKVDKLDKQTQRRAGAIMHLLGWRRSVTKIYGKSIRTWKRIDYRGETPDMLDDKPPAAKNDEDWSK